MSVYVFSWAGRRRGQKSALSVCIGKVFSVVGFCCSSSCLLLLFFFFHLLTFASKSCCLVQVGLQRTCTCYDKLDGGGGGKRESLRERKRAKERERDRQTDRQRQRETGRQAGRQADRQRQTE